MNSDELYEIYHHGILGMKWGVRRYQNKDGTLTTAGRKHLRKNGAPSKNTKFDDNSTTKKKTTKDLSDEELQSKIRRLELEKRYKDLSKPAEQKKMFDGKRFIMDVLEKSGKNIATQFTTYAMGTAVNKAFGSDIVNPKKGQKDK